MHRQPRVSELESPLRNHSVSTLKKDNFVFAFLLYTRLRWRGSRGGSLKLVFSIPNLSAAIQNEPPQCVLREQEEEGREGGSSTRLA